MGWTEASVEGDISSNGTGKGKTLETVKISVVSRGWRGEKETNRRNTEELSMVRLFCVILSW